MKSFLSKLVVVAAFVAAPVTASFAVPTFSFSSPSGALHPAGSHFSVDLIGSGFSDLYAYQFSVTFNPAILHVLGVTEGAFLQTGGATFFDGGTIDNTTGNVSFAFDTLISAVAGVSGSGVLAHLDLAAVAFGSSSLGLADVLALNSLLDAIAVTSQPITLAVPEPGIVALMVVAAGACLANRKRRPGKRAISDGDVVVAA